MATIQNCSREIEDNVFTSLLASAFSLQQNQDRFRSKVPSWRSEELTRAVLDTQALVRRHAIHPETALELIASRTQKLSDAAGSAIAFLDGEILEYKITCGIATALQGCRILADASCSFEQLKNQPFTESTTWRDRALSARLVATSVLSVPITRDGKLAGCIQLFSRVGQFGEEATYVLQLMSAILNQLIEDTEFGQSLGRYDGAMAGEAGAGAVARGKHTRLMRQTAASIPTSDVETPERKVMELNHDLGKQATGDGSSLKSSDRDRDKVHTPEDQRQSKIWLRLKRLIYPFVVLLFVVIANTSGRAHIWPVLLGTVLIVAVTAVEILQRLSD